MAKHKSSNLLRIVLVSFSILIYNITFSFDIKSKLESGYHTGERTKRSNYYEVVQPIRLKIGHPKRYDEMLVAHQYSIKLPLDYVDLNIICSGDLYYIPDGQYIMIQRYFTPPSTKYDEISDSLYIPSDEEIFNFISYLNIEFCYSIDILESLKHANGVEYEYRHALIHNYLLQNYTRQLIDISESEHITTNGENRMLIKTGLKILLFNIDPNNLEYFETIAKGIEIRQTCNLDSIRQYLDSAPLYLHTIRI